MNAEIVFEHQGQQGGSGFDAENGAAETSGDELGNAAHVVYVAMGDDEGAGEVEGILSAKSITWIRFAAGTLPSRL